MKIKQQYICVTIKDRIGTIYLNRPEKRNALNGEFVKELCEAFKNLEEDENVKIVVLKAKGDVFSAGADLAYLKKLQTNTFEENLEDSNNLKSLFSTIYFLKKVVIAQVEGHAIAGGCGLATVCDFTYSVPEAKFGYTEVKIGFIPAIVMGFLIRKIGETKAKLLLLTGELIGAEQALAIGLISGICTKDNIEIEVAKLADKLCKETAASSLSLTKEMIDKVQSMDMQDAFDYAAEQNAKARETEECKKGIAAFLNKEKINW